MLCRVTTIPRHTDTIQNTLDITHNQRSYNQKPLTHLHMTHLACVNTVRKSYFYKTTHEHRLSAAILYCIRLSCCSVVHTESSLNVFVRRYISLVDGFCMCGFGAVAVAAVYVPTHNAFSSNKYVANQFSHLLPASLCVVWNFVIQLTNSVT